MHLTSEPVLIQQSIVSDIGNGWSDHDEKSGNATASCFVNSDSAGATGGLPASANELPIANVGEPVVSQQSSIDRLHGNPKRKRGTSFAQPVIIELPRLRFLKLCN